MTQLDPCTRVNATESFYSGKVTLCYPDILKDNFRRLQPQPFISLKSLLSGTQITCFTYEREVFTIGGLGWKLYYLFV